ncbi:MAG: sortase [Patescibacteria group bacterium]
MRRFFSLSLTIIGLFLLLSVILPISLSQLSFSLQPKLLDPTAVSLVPAPYVANILGITTPDYTQPTAWFPAASSTPSISRVRYYTLSIPKLNLRDVPVEINGTDLKKNAIHFSGTALPGDYGNTVIFGHSTLPALYKPNDPVSIFNPLPKIKVGDSITIQYDGVTYKYVVRNTTEVDPSQIEVLAQRYDKNELTLITCVPLGTYLRRFVARAELVN